MQLRALLLFFFVVVALYNICAIYVTYLLSSVWHAILETFRPCAVWGVDLALYYLFSHSVGEAWTRWSWMELAGLVVMLAGIAVYKNSVRQVTARSCSYL